ncbi:hypothetical protein Tco_0805245 [Tanacetum coccineum]
MKSEHYCLNYLGLEVGAIRRIQVLDMAYWGFLGVGTTLDIFQNIILIPYLEYGVLSLSRYGVLSFILLWSLVEADAQAIQTILLSLPEYIYVVVDSCESAQEIWLRVQQMLKGSDIGIQEKKAKLFNEWKRFTSTDGESIESYYHHFSKLMNDFGMKG